MVVKGAIRNLTTNQNHMAPKLLKELRPPKATHHDGANFLNQATQQLEKLLKLNTYGCASGDTLVLMLPPVDNVAGKLTFSHMRKPAASDSILSRSKSVYTMMDTAKGRVSACLLLAS